MHRRSRRRRLRRARRARPKPVLAQALPQRLLHRPRRRGRRRARSMWPPGPSRREAQEVPRVEVWAAVRVAWRAQAERRRRGRRRQRVAVARRARRCAEGAARWVVVQARRALAPEREAAWERAAARPTGCWRAAGSKAPSAVEGQWADRRRLPSPHRRLVRQCRRRPSAPTGLPAELVPPPDGDDKGELGLLMPGEPEGPPPHRLGADWRTRARDRQEQGRRAGAGRRTDSADGERLAAQPWRRALDHHAGPPAIESPGRSGWAPRALPTPSEAAASTTSRRPIRTG